MPSESLLSRWPTAERRRGGGRKWPTLSVPSSHRILCHIPLGTTPQTHRTELPSSGRPLQDSCLVHRKNTCGIFFLVWYPFAACPGFPPGGAILPEISIHMAKVPPPLWASGVTRWPKSGSSEHFVPLEIDLGCGWTSPNRPSPGITAWRWEAWSQGPGSQDSNPSSALTGCVTLGNLYACFVPLLPYALNEANNGWWLNEIISVKHLESFSPTRVLVMILWAPPDNPR